MRIVVFFGLLIALSFSLKGQVKKDVTLTGKHAKAISTGNRYQSDAKAKRAEVRGKIKEIKSARKELKQYKKAKEKYSSEYEKAKAEKMEALKASDLSPDLDSLVIAEEVLALGKLNSKQTQILLHPPKEVVRLDSMYFERRKQEALEEAEHAASSEITDYLPEELASTTENPAKQLMENTPLEANDFGSLDLTQLGNPNPNVIKPTEAQALFEKVDPEEFMDVQGQTKKLKKKYSEMPDIRSKEDGVKRNSLEDVPFTKRLSFGGNFNVQSTDPLIINVNLQLGYWLNKNWLTGVGLIWREQFSRQDSAGLVSGDGHGYSLFTRYNIKQGFFIWAESEFQANRSFFESDQSLHTDWQQTYLIGLGREFELGPVRMNTTILYDFNYQNNTINSRPWVFRVGWQIGSKQN